MVSGMPSPLAALIQRDTRQTRALPIQPEPTDAPHYEANGPKNAMSSSLSQPERCIHAFPKK
jgi:hypothetical protein